MIGHLSVYSCYSFQNSTILIEELCKKANQLQYETIALTDINNMYGAMEFTKYAHLYNLKPIYGLTANVDISSEIYPLIILARDQQGYRDLIKVCSIINLSDNKAIDLEQLASYSSHLFVLSGCKEGIIERLILKEMESEALKYIKAFKDMFKDNFYICIQDHDLMMQKHLNERLIALATIEQVKVCCSNEVRYLDSKDALTLELLQSSAKSQTIDEHHQLQTNQLYLKDKYEMDSLFTQEIIDNTNNILRLCNVTIETGQMHLPKYPTPNNASSKDYLQQLCVVGLKKRFQGKDVPKGYIQRLKKELSVISQMGFDDYFLIVFDYVRYAKSQGILVGPGRGSAAGSLVAYVLGITNVDPIKYDLLFERFLNIERVSMPDIDIDFQDDRRDEIVNYVTQKYGQDYVGQIVTFSTYGPKVALKDLGKVIKIPLPKLEMLAKYIPTGPKNKKTVKEVYETSYSFQSMVNQDPMLQKIIPAICTVEFLPRNISMHAAGVVLSRDRLDDIVPLTLGPTSNVLTQYSKKYIEEVGLLKMDFLGLKNLTIISYILKDIEHNKGIKLNINEIDLNDQKTFKMIANADTFGVFQLESSGMKSLLRKMKCDCLDDVVAAVALYRPGPMANIPSYIARKNGEEAITYSLDALKEITKNTYGILIYQEQIMQVATTIAGFSLSKADMLRVAMSSKDAKVMEKVKQEFIDGSIKNGYSEIEANDIFSLIYKFADYGFNKAHSVAYGIIAYQLAYLKANYPLEFYSAILSNEQSSEVNKANCISESKKYSIKILPPSINYSLDRFTVEGDNIRYSLLGIKNVGYAGYLAIAKEREKGLFKDLFDFVGRMDSSKINSKMFESLIDAGAFDEFNVNRATIKDNIHKINEYAQLKNTLGIDEPPIMTIVKENKVVRLELEKQVLGVYLTMHPIALIKENIPHQVTPVNTLENYVDKRVNVIISLSRVKPYVDKKGNEMCFFTGYDETGEIEGVVFASSYQSLKDVIERNNIILVDGKINNRDKLSLVINNARKLS